MPLLLPFHNYLPEMLVNLRRIFLSLVRVYEQLPHTVVAASTIRLFRLDDPTLPTDRGRGEE